MKKFSRGFTIVELLVVIVVIGLLATIVTVAYNGISQRAKDNILLSDKSSVNRQLEAFYALNGKYPSANNCVNPGTTEICLKTSSGNTVTYSPLPNSTTASTYSLDWSSGVASTDPNFNSVALLLKTSTSIYDAKNNTITSAGSPSVSSAQSKFGGSSIFFNGSGSYVYTPYSATKYDWWTNDFTIEAWVYPTGWTGWSFVGDGLNLPTMVSNSYIGSLTHYWGFGPRIDGKLAFTYWNGGPNQVVSATSLQLSTWTHVAMSKTSSGIRLFINGVQDSSASVVGTPMSSSINGHPLAIGGSNNTYINGYIDDLRITKGVARYTSSFTSPTSELPAQ